MTTHDPVPWEGEEGPYGPIGVPLVDLLDRVLATGVVIKGDLVIAIAEVPLVRLSLNALLASVSERVPSPWADSGPL
ncbi:gas vesicle protein [Streptomyces sp. ACA25]|uniref:gas vesicle protein n=1 Tax=Streptomyces sp. ACA25 TaxID=3022596 RepID=UPI002306FE3A|nr:gas vesicle protein [Streptomyces sp. ACA25]MDB1088198.1 gas vesicle protein [Streptomyces sp. ACA25]